MFRLKPPSCALRGALPRTAVLTALLLAAVPLGGCAPEPGGAAPQTPAPEDTPPPQEVQSSRHAMAAGRPDPESPSSGGTSLGLLDTTSHAGPLTFHFDAFVVSATVSGTARLRTDVLSANPSSYVYGYAYPVSIAPIEEGVQLGQSGGNYVQNALDTGTALLDYPVVAGRQYILTYKTFAAFMPLTYRLTLSEGLVLEGRIHTLPEPVPVPAPAPGPITLQNPKPKLLEGFVQTLQQRVGSN